MATKRQITLRFKDEYAKASKKDKGVILDRMCETLKIGRSTARRRLKEAGRAGEGREAPRERPKRYSDRSRLLLEQVWLLMDLPCAKYMKEMLPQWIPTLLEAGELRGFDTATVDELLVMSAATMDRYLEARARRRQPQGHGVHPPGGRAAAQLDHDQEGRRRARRPARQRGGRHRRPLRSQPQGRVLPHPDRRRLRHRMDRERFRQEQRVQEPLQGRGRDRGAPAVRHPLLRQRQRQRVHQPGLHQPPAGASTWNRPGAGHTGRTTKPPSSRATTTSSAGTRSTTGTSPPNSTCSMSYGSSCGSRRTCSPHPRNPSDGPAPATGRPKRVYDQPVTPWERLKRFDDEGPRQGRPRLHQTRAARADRKAHRRNQPRRTRPAHPRHPGRTRAGRHAADQASGKKARPGHGILEQDARPDHRRGRQRNRRRTSRRELGIHAQNR